MGIKNFIKKNKARFAGILAVAIILVVTFSVALQTTKPLYHGTVVFVKENGGFFGIVRDDGKRLYPVNLPEAYQRDGLRIIFSYVPVAVAVNIPWGQPIKIYSIIEEQTFHT